MPSSVKLLVRRVLEKPRLKLLMIKNETEPSRRNVNVIALGPLHEVCQATIRDEKGV
jgi:hypothetical protein